MSDQSQEQVVFEKGAVKVTTSRAILGEKTYAMSNIASVATAKKDESGYAPAAMILGGLGAVILGTFSIQGGGSSPWLVLVFGGIVLVAGIRLSSSRNPDYIVRISSASGESDALSSKDQEYIREIVVAINEAVVKRG